MSRRILVYTDGGEGASEACVAMAIRELKRAVSWITGREAPKEGKERGCVVEKTDAAAISRGILKERCCRLLVLPGGRDLPYCSKLNGKGNEQIREFVRRGGSYLGLCAGGYYGASYVQFSVGDPVLEVVGPRELKFYPGVARGPIFPGFHYDSNAGARVCPISLQPGASLLDKSCRFEDTPPHLLMFYNGGGYFSDVTASEPALRKHLHNNRDEVLPTNIKVLATYDTSCGQQDAPLCDSTTPIIHSDAPLPDRPIPDNPAAIISMQYGAGRVVLSGVHPEASAAALTEAYGGDKYIEPLVDELRASESVRASVFNALVSHLLYQV